LAVFVPAVVELALIFVGPLLHDVVRAVNRTTCPIHIKRLIGLESFVLTQPAYCIFGKVLAQVIALFGSLWRQDNRGVAHQMRLILRGFTGEKAVEIFETAARRPVIERTRSGRFLCRSVVPFSPCRGAVAVVLQNLGGKSTAFWNMSRVAIPV